LQRVFGALFPLSLLLKKLNPKKFFLSEKVTFLGRFKTLIKIILKLFLELPSLIIQILEQQLLSILDYKEGATEKVCKFKTPVS
jgi:hypothetical protein